MARRGSPNGSGRGDERRHSTDAIPKRAVLAKESRKTVYVVSEGRVQARPIIVQKEVGGDAFVSPSLIGNESIIVGDQLSQLKVGDRVQVSGSRSAPK